MALMAASSTKNAKLDDASTIDTSQPRALRVVIYGMNFSPEVAGVGKYTGEIAEHLVSEALDVVVVTTPPHYPGWSVQIGYRNRYSRSQESGLTVFRAPVYLSRKMGGLSRLLAPVSFGLTSAPVIIWQILRFRPDVVFCVEPTLIAAPLAQLVARFVGARTVLHVQDLEVDAAFAVGHLNSKPWLKWLGYAFERFVLGKFDNIITISNRMASKLIEKGVVSDRLTVIRNWVDLEHIFPMNSISPYRKELGFVNEDFIVLYSGNIGAKQGLSVLLDAAEILGPNGRIKFVVAGEGPAKAALQQRYSNLNNVLFLPFQPYSRLNEFLNMADLHALPQEKSAADLVLPSKLGGMLASGKPIIVTAEKDTELAEFLGSSASVIPPADATILASTICRIAEGEVPNAVDRLKLSQLLAKKDGLLSLTAVVRPIVEDL